MSDYSKLKETKEANLTKGRKKGAKKDKTIDQEKQEVDQNAIQQANLNTLKLLVDGVLKKPINLIWPERRIEEEFVRCFLKTGFDMLQHNQANAKTEELKKILFEML